MAFFYVFWCFFFFQAEDGIRDLVRSRGLGDVYKRQAWLRPFYLGDQQAFTLDHEVMLWHLYRHMIVEPWRLIRLVDLVADAFLL